MNARRAKVGLTLFYMAIVNCPISYTLECLTSPGRFVYLTRTTIWVSKDGGLFFVLEVGLVVTTCSPVVEVQYRRAISSETEDVMSPKLMVATCRCHGRNPRHWND